MNRHRRPGGTACEDVWQSGRRRCGSRRRPPGGQRVRARDAPVTLGGRRRKKTANVKGERETRGEQRDAGRDESHRQGPRYSGQTTSGEYFAVAGFPGSRASSDMNYDQDGDKPKPVRTNEPKARDDRPRLDGSIGAKQNFRTEPDDASKCSETWVRGRSGSEGTTTLDDVI
ncbi:hypothetical protein AAG570_005033 [Ranatra chinensis]|uniref:Uncharacterized protein n=1 Tax=Ranatra chinensis TaxID=642074 RepID=A0ABD0XZD5_9HEMI